MMTPKILRRWLSSTGHRVAKRRMFGLTPRVAVAGTLSGFRRVPLTSALFLSERGLTEALPNGIIWAFQMSDRSN